MGNRMSKIKTWKIIGFAGIAIVMLIVLVSLSLTATSASSSSSTGTASLSKNGLTSHDPIYINGNSDFTSANGVTGGNGMEGNPYIIESYDINASSTDGIHIENTDVYFIIKNCYIHEGKHFYVGNYGIHFYNVTHGNIDNITSDINYQGIYITSSSNIIIKNSFLLSNADWGIRISASSNITTTNCTFQNNWGGILFSSSLDNRITNCTISDYKTLLRLWQSSRNNIQGCVVESNECGFISYYSLNNTIANCKFSENNEDGISLYSSLNNQITNCTISYNSLRGISFDNSSENQITNCVISNNIQGAYLSSSSDKNCITACDIYNNYYGVEFYASSNNILRSDILENNTYNFGVQGVDISDFYQDIDTSNIINGKPIYYIVEQNNLVFNNTLSTGYLGLVSCNNTRIENITFTDNIQGLLLANTSYSGITNCTGYNNYYGICLVCSTNNTIIYPTTYDNEYGIYLGSSSSNTVTNCAFLSNNKYGIKLYNSSNNQITNSTISNNSYKSIFLDCSLENQIFHCTVSDNSQYGICLYSSMHNTITNSTISNNSKYSIHLTDTSNCNQITNCQISNNSDYGIAIRDTSNYNNISECRISDNGGGIYIYWPQHIGWYSYTQITNCEISNNSADGIYFAGMGESQVINCTICGNTGHGINAYSSWYNGIVNCTISSNSQNGISASNLYDNQIIGCTVSNNYVDGLYFSAYSGRNQITNCKFYGNSNHGINIYSSGAADGNQITNCEVFNNSGVGVRLTGFSDNNQIAGCTIANNALWGIVVSKSLCNQITNCIISSNSEGGIYLSTDPWWRSSDNQITNCTISNNSQYGVWLQQSSGNKFCTTKIEGSIYNFRIDGEEASHFYQDIDTSNIVSGKPIYYMRNQQNFTLDGNVTDIGYLVLVSCKNITIKNVNISYNGQGILLVDTSDSVMRNCTTSMNNYGIYLFSSSDNQIINCTVSNNSQSGIYLPSSSWYTHSDYNQIVNCNILNNSEHGVCIASYSKSNSIHHNNFINNSIQACDGSSNSWNNESEGNYWDDYSGSDSNKDGIGDTPYNISGGETKDNYPLMCPFGTDSIAPVSSIKTLCGYWYNTTSITITANAYDPLSFGSGVKNISLYYRYSSNNLTWDDWELFETDTSPTWEWLFDAPDGDGYYQFYSIASDNASNVEATPEIADITCGIDTTAPTGSIVINEGNIWTNSTAVTLTLNWNDTFSGVFRIRYSNGGIWDTEEWEMPLTIKYWDLTLGDEVKTVYYQIMDRAGLMSEFNDTIILDTTPPIISITGAADNTYYNTNITPIVDVTDANLDTNSTTLNEDSFESGGAITNEGNYLLFVLATDKAGNVNETTISFVIDKTKPDITITGVTDCAYYSVSVTPVIEFNDANLNVTTITLSGFSFESGTTITEEDIYVLAAHAIDRAGNTASKTISFIIDKTKPTITVTSPAEGLITNQNVTLNYTISDRVSLVENITVTGDGSPYTEEGNYSITLTATDQAGNTAEKTITFTIDKTEPGISELTPATGTKTTKSSIVVSGKTELDADVKINGVNVPVSVDGSFSKEITLVKGENTIAVTATDLAGNMNTQTITVTKEAEKEQKGFISGFETGILLLALLYIIWLVKRRKR